MRLTVTILLLVFSTTIHLSAQDYIIDVNQFTTEDGLANLKTHVVHKGKDGFLWIATKYGLNRYDGYNFQLYTKEKNGLHHNEFVSHIIDGENGTLLVFYYDYKTDKYSKIYAADVFDTKTQKAIPFQTYFEDKLPFKVKDILPVTINDKKKRPLIVTRNGNLFLLDKGKFIKVFKTANKEITTVSVDEKDNIYIGVGNEILICDFKGNIINRLSLPNKANQIWIDESHQIWAESNYVKDDIEYISLLKYTKNSYEIYHTFQREFVYNTQNALTGFYYIGNHNWIITEPLKVYIKNFANNYSYNLYEDLTSANYLLKFAICRDNNMIWVAEPKGLYQISYKTNSFKYIYQNTEIVDCRGITEDRNGNVYFNCREVFQYSSKTNRTEMLLDSANSYAIQYYNSTLFVSNYDIYSLGKGLNLNTKKITSYRTHPIRSSIFCLLKTNQADEFLVGTEKGLFYINLKTSAVQPFENYNDFDILKTASVNAFQKKDNQIWIATNQGMFLMTEEKGVIYHFSTASEDLPFDHINHFSIDKDNTFWLASRGFGLIKWQPNQDEKSTYQTYTINEGLSHNYLYAVYEDDDNKLWITSDKGLMLFDKETEQVRIFTTSDGLRHNEFNFTSHYKATDGTFYFGGLGGIFSFHPKDFSNQQSNKTHLKITAISVLENDKNQPTNKISEYHKEAVIKLYPNDKFIELEFALLDFIDNDNHLYAYRMKGYQDTWTYLDDNSIRFSNLPYGNYTIEIKGKSGSKDWSEERIAVKIRVLKPFYLQWWFVGLSFSFVAFLIYGVFRYRTRQLEKDKQQLANEVKKRTQQIETDRAKIAIQAQKLAELDELKNRFFTNITHEFRTPLTLIIGPVEQILKKVPPPTVLKRRMKGVLKNAQLILNNINQILELTKIEAGKVKVTISHGDIIQNTREMIETFEPLVAKKSQRLIFQPLPTEWKTNFDINKWNKIIYNLVLNAVKFTPKEGVIKVNLVKEKTAENEFIKLSVKDTGVGIPKAELDNIFEHFYQIEQNVHQQEIGSGIGLALVKELVELQNGQVKVTSEIGKGTSFFVQLPIITQLTPTLIPIQSNLSHFPVMDYFENEEVSSKTHLKNEKLDLLIVEDNEEIREYLSYCLNEQAYNIHEAKNGAEGIEKALTIIPDLIISDVMMPQKDGFQLTTAMRSNATTSHIPIILLTAKATLKSRLKGLSRGADVYLTKPFSPDELLTQVQKLISIRRLLQQQYGQSSIQELPTTQKNIYPQEDVFIKKINAYILKNLNNSELNGDQIGKHLLMSRVHLHRKLKALTNQSITEYIRMLRLNKALELLKSDEFTVSEVAYRTGFNSVSYFSRSFKKQFDKNPSEVR